MREPKITWSQTLRQAACQNRYLQKSSPSKTFLQFYDSKLMHLNYHNKSDRKITSNETFPEQIYAGLQRSYMVCPFRCYLIGVPIYSTHQKTGGCYLLHSSVKESFLLHCSSSCTVALIEGDISGQGGMLAN